MIESIVRGVTCTLLLACLAVTAAPAGAQIIDRVLVIVNDGVITESEFIDAMRQTVAELRARGTPVPERRLLEEQVMEQLILERIQLQISDRLGIEVSDTQVARAIEEIARPQGASAEQLLREADRAGIGADRYREEIRKQLRIQRLVDREVRRRVQVSESEIDEMVSIMARSAQESGVEYQVAHISLLLDDAEDQGEREQALERARQIRGELDQGATFESLARQYSQSPTAADGGSLGWRTADKLPDLFREAVSSLDIGEISDVLETSGGVHLVTLLDRRGGAGQLVDQWRVRHILIPAEDESDLRQARETALRLRERILQGEDFAELARVHSADPGSRLKGGDLGWISPGDTVPTFEEAVRNIELNVISEAVESPFGVHLIEVLDRRRHDVGASRMRLQAQRNLQEQKAREAYDQWLRRLRDEAYVKFRVRPG
jgi:peptidyl-prolyl cis-trans isomerase SurA